MAPLFAASLFGALVNKFWTQNLLTSAGLTPRCAPRALCIGLLHDPRAALNLRIALRHDPRTPRRTSVAVPPALRSPFPNGQHAPTWDLPPQGRSAARRSTNLRTTSPSERGKTGDFEKWQKPEPPF